MTDWPAFFRWLVSNLPLILVGALVLVMFWLVCLGLYRLVSFWTG